MTENFLNLYTTERMLSDLKFVKSYKNLFFLFHKKEDRIRHKAKFWGAWLRHHRWMRIKQPAVYIITVLTNRDYKENNAYDYINQLDNKV